MREASQKGLVVRALLGPALILTAATAFAQPPTTTFNLIGIQGQLGLQGTVMAGAYTGPYLADIGGSTVGTNVICDDYADNSYVPEEWDAYITPLTQLDSNLSYVNFGTSNTSSTFLSSEGYSLGTNQAYITEAILAEQLLQQPMGSVAGGELNFAIWELFDSQAATDLQNYNPTYAAAAQNYLNTAVAAAQGDTLSQFSNVTLYSYDPPPSQGGTGTLPYNCNGSCPPAPQEFIVVNDVPEPSSVAVLGADLLALGALVFFLRRRMVQN